MVKEYTHELDTEVRSISGGYMLDTEAAVEIRGRDVLYAVGNGVVDSACCGTFGCRFAYVPGYVIASKYRADENGVPVSLVEPIGDEKTRREITEFLEREESVTQVRFL